VGEVRQLPNLIDAMNHDAASLTQVTRHGAPLADWASSS
jgi:hypothetical protein